MPSSFVCLSVPAGSTPTPPFTCKSPLQTCSPGLHSRLCDILWIGIFLSCVQTTCGTYFHSSSFSFQIGLLRLAFCSILPSSSFEADEARVIRDELSKEIFLGRNEYFYTNFWKKKHLLIVPTIRCAKSLGILNAFFDWFVRLPGTPPGFNFLSRYKQNSILNGIIM